MSDQQVGSSLTPRPVQPADGASLHALLRSGLPDIPVDVSRWKVRWNWRYLDNPFREDRPAGWVLADGGRVAGHLGAVYVPVIAGGRRMTGAIGSDYVVLPEMLRAGGVFAGLQLAEAFFGGTAGCLRMATTANEKTGAVFGRFGCRPLEWTREFWRAPTTLAQQIRTCRGGVNRAMRRLMGGPLGSVSRTMMSALYAIARHRPALPVPSGLRLDVGMPDMILEAVPLWERLVGGEVGSSAAVQSFLAIDRTREYLDWRYVRHPEAAGMRSLLVRTRDGQAVGAGVVFVEEQVERRVAFMEELMAPPGRPEVMHALVCAALRAAGDLEAGHLVCTAGRQELRGRFWEYGFESRARSAPALLVRAGDLSSDFDTTRLISTVEFHHGDMF